MSADDGAMAIYVHWPYCAAKCPYCDFNSHVRDRVDERRWARAIAAELAHYARRTADRRVASIYFGGGTPSLMTPDTAAEVIAAVARLWPGRPPSEITLEANPGSVDTAHLAGYRAAGVDRVSLGVQALRDEALRFLGRQHDVATARQAVAAAHRHFDRVSFDLIYARPDQTTAAWRAELDDALSLAGEHLSLYQLTIEPGTAFHAAARRGARLTADEGTGADLFEATQARTAAAGLPAYEISNHARPGAESRHNLIYWQYGDYVGVGPGAHGRLTCDGARLATRQERSPETWMATVERDGHATADVHDVPVAQQVEELLLMGLRLTSGVSRAAFRRIAGADVAAWLPNGSLEKLCDEGLLHLDEQSLTATAAGRQRLNAVLAALLAA